MGVHVSFFSIFDPWSNIRTLNKKARRQKFMKTVRKWHLKDVSVFLGNLAESRIFFPNIATKEASQKLFWLKEPWMLFPGRESPSYKLELYDSPFSV